MNKAELISKISEKSQLTKKDSEKALNAFLKVVEEALASGERVQIVGFGTFEVRQRAARQGRNPRNPEQVIDIPATNAAIFKCGKGLRDLVNSNKQIIQ